MKDKKIITLSFRTLSLALKDKYFIQMKKKKNSKLNKQSNIYKIDSNGTLPEVYEYKNHCKRQWKRTHQVGQEGDLIFYVYIKISRERKAKWR